MNIPTSLTDPNKRYDFLLLFDVSDGNPNGDPDAGNLPRVDPETMQGIVTDVCIKRKIRNYVDLIHTPSGDLDLADTGSGNGFGIFVRDSGIALNTKLREGALAVGAKPDKKRTNSDARTEICRRYYDVRLFGGVLSVGEYNCGQVRGPMQLTFSRSIDPIIPGDVAITRVAITKEGEAKETEIGRKAQIPYGLYLGKGFYSPMLGKDTGVTSADLELFWQAVLGMFEIDRSAARGYMQLQRLVVFVHESPLGNAPSGKLFPRLSVIRKPGVAAPRSIDHYDVVLDLDGLPANVTAEELGA